MPMKPVYDFICSIGELIDKLTIENIKCYDANNKIIALRKQPPSHGCVVEVEISLLERAARMSGEQRVRLRDEINARLADAIMRGGICVAPEVRTYRNVGGE